MFYKVLFLFFYKRFKDVKIKKFDFFIKKFNKKGKNVFDKLNQTIHVL